MHPTALDDVNAAQPGLVEHLAETRTAQKQLYAELLALRGRYQHAHRAYCAAYAAIRNHGVRERVHRPRPPPRLTASRRFRYGESPFSARRVSLFDTASLPFRHGESAFSRRRTGT